MMKISVIVPVYNSSDYIGRCIDSVLNQTYNNFELILVDDGSIDNSLSILKEYEIKDKRIKVFTQKNSGPGVARNLGIAKATGDYIVFVDSDDYIDEEYFDLLSKKDDDVVFIDVNQVNEKFEMISEEHISIYASKPKDYIIRSQLTGKIPWGGVRKAVKRVLLANNHIKYSNLQIGEEALYSFLVLYYAKSFSFINKAVYSYVNRTNSQSKKNDEDPWTPVYLNLKDKIINIGEYNTFSNTLNSFLITSLMVSLYRKAFCVNYKEYKQKICENEKIFKENYDYRVKLDKKSIKKKIYILYCLFKLRLTFLLYLIFRFKGHY